MRHKEGGYTYVREGTVHEYEAMWPSPDISIVALQDARLRLPHARVYTIHAGKFSFEDAIEIQRELAMKSINNPFAAIVNLHYETELENREWYVSTQASTAEFSYAVGSRGC